MTGFSFAFYAFLVARKGSEHVQTSSALSWNTNWTTNANWDKFARSGVHSRMLIATSEGRRAVIEGRRRSGRDFRCKEIFLHVRSGLGFFCFVTNWTGCMEWKQRELKRPERERAFVFLNPQLGALEHPQNCWVEEKFPKLAKELKRTPKGNWNISIFQIWMSFVFLQVEK